MTGDYQPSRICRNHCRPWRLLRRCIRKDMSTRARRLGAGAVETHRHVRPMSPSTPLRALKCATVIMLAACASEPIGSSGNGSIRGTVTENSTPMVNVAVALTGNAQAARTAKSGADGAYTFADLPPGTYTLTVEPPNGFNAGSAGVVSVTVASGAQVNAAAFVLNRVTVDPGEWG